MPGPTRRSKSVVKMWGTVGKEVAYESDKNEDVIESPVFSEYCPSIKSGNGENAT
jgi:hypothetical protein